MNLRNPELTKNVSDKSSNFNQRYWKKSEAIRDWIKDEFYKVLKKNNNF